MLKEPISITTMASLSPLGSSEQQVVAAYRSPKHAFTQRDLGGESVWVAALSKEDYQAVTALRKTDSKYEDLDDTVLYGILVGRKAVEAAGWESANTFGINFGSSRGATALFENFHEVFLKQDSVPTRTSPTTTLGNISSWLAHDLNAKGPTISHSITCSTALHAVLNGVAWIQSGLTDRFLVGGSEAPLTPFTIRQIQALKIYSRAQDEYPSRALDFEKTKNSMILGEGAAALCLEKEGQQNSIAKIIGIGYATEALTHNVSISTDAACFQTSMAMALGDTSPSEVDAIVLHAPGTVKGDKAEYEAIKTVFCNKIPFLTTNKWKVGHTFGTSGALSLEMAILMMRHQEYFKVPFTEHHLPASSIQNVLVNAVGFGGNAVSILLSI
ncbi:MAG: beta-ketoacyl synthase N-terminal-like domain-containing protein [Bacteroidota bacterium]